MKDIEVHIYYYEQKAWRRNEERKKIHSSWHHVIAKQPLFLITIIIRSTGIHHKSNAFPLFRIISNDCNSRLKPLCLSFCCLSVNAKHVFVTPNSSQLNENEIILFWNFLLLRFMIIICAHHENNSQYFWIK